MVSVSCVGSGAVLALGDALMTGEIEAAALVSMAESRAVLTNT